MLLKHNVRKNALDFIYLANFDHGRNAGGPCLNTSSAVSENPSDGIFAFLHIS